MIRNSVIIAMLVVSSVFCAEGQEPGRWNFHVGGGIGFPQATTGDFVGNAAHLEIGAGPNLTSHVGIAGEFMWHDLPIKQSVIDAFDVPDAGAREYTVTLNAIVRIPTHGRMGFYAIGGGGWYHRSGEVTAPALVPGTKCPIFWEWWGTCVSGLWPTNVVLASASSDAFGGNIGGGITYRLGSGPLSFYTEVRYHHASHNQVDTDLLPVSLGLRW